MLAPAWPGVTYATHQVEGIQWMMNLEQEGYSAPNTDYVVRGGILGDEMGLGKTMQSLALIVNGEGKNTLILTPLAVRKQWEVAAANCRLNLYIAEKNGFVRKGRMILNGKSIYLGHYDKLVSDLALFQSVKWDRIILDEAHRIRNTKTVTGSSVLSLRATYKWALTATPIVNSLDDIVTYLKFIGFKGLGPGWSSSYRQWIPHVYMARTLDECEAPAGLTMPPDATTETRRLEFTSKDEEEVYNGILNNLETKWRSAKALQGREYQLQKFAILLRLRQVSVNPQIYIRARQKEMFGWAGPEFNLPSRKFDEISHLMRESVEAGESNRWIVFCQFRDEMVLLSEFLKAFPYTGSVLQYHGGMSMKERDDAIEQSKVLSSDGKQDVFLVQLQAGGTGLNLQHYNRIIFTSPWWTSALLEQAKGRAIRIGQKDPVKIYWLKLKAEEDRFSIDDFIMEKADNKKELAKEFLSLAHNKKITQI
jgi:SNF2 family DNA or RNA helicase